MRKASTGMPEQGTQAPFPAPDLIPAGNEKQPRAYTEIGTANGGTSGQLNNLQVADGCVSPSKYMEVGAIVGGIMGCGFELRAKYTYRSNAADS